MPRADRSRDGAAACFADVSDRNPGRDPSRRETPLHDITIGSVRIEGSNRSDAEIIVERRAPPRHSRATAAGD
jgi:hypothetical protein